MNKLPSNRKESCVNILERSASVISATKLKKNPEKSNDQKSPKSLNTNSPSNKFDLPSFNCTECSYKSIWKHAVKRHQQIHFNNEHGKRVKLECNFCSHISDNWEEFKDHQKLHKASEQTSRERLQGESTQNPFEHRNSELKETNKTLKQKVSKAIKYKCEKCKFESEYDDNFKNHKKIHDTEYKSGVFECDQCDYNSKKKKLFLKHIRMLHEERSHDGEDSVIPCKESSEKIKPNSQTSPKRTYRCGKYADVPVKVTKNGLFECEHCSYQTAIRTALVKHQTNHLKYI